MARGGSFNSLPIMDEPRWLTDEQQRAWRRFIAVMIKLPAALEAQLQRDAGLTHVGYIVLSTLSEQSQRTLPMSRLAAMASASLSRLSHVVSRLEAQGWVRRERHPQDGRVQLAVLTDAGYAKVVDVAPGHAEAVQQFVFDALSRVQIRQLERVCEALLTQQQALARGTAPQPLAAQRVCAQPVPTEAVAAQPVPTEAVAAEAVTPPPPPSAKAS
jgi:DNA-binding MarR family transcriptional regulator